MQLTVKVDSAQVAAQLARAAQAISNTTPLMAAIGQRLESNISERFDTKTDPAGNAWAPYKAISAAIHKAIHGKEPSGSLLQRHIPGLHTGIEHHASADAVEVGLTATVTSKKGNTLSLGAIHEFGTTGRGKKGGGAIPRRGMVFGAVTGQGQSAQVTQALSAGDEADVIAIIQRHIEQATSGL